MLVRLRMPRMTACVRISFRATRRIGLLEEELDVPFAGSKVVVSQLIAVNFQNTGPEIQAANICEESAGNRKPHVSRHCSFTFSQEIPRALWLELGTSVSFPQATTRRPRVLRAQSSPRFTCTSLRWSIAAIAPDSCNWLQPP